MSKCLICDICGNTIWDFKRGAVYVYRTVHEHVPEQYSYDMCAECADALIAAVRAKRRLDENNENNRQDVKI